MEVLPHHQLRRRDDDDDNVRILQLTDMHLFPEGTTAWHCSAKGSFAPRVVDFAAEAFPTPYKQHDTADLVRSIILGAKPHLVIFTGDIVDGRPFGTKNPGKVSGVSAAAAPGAESFQSFSRAFSSVLAPLHEHGVPWCFCPGNHDDDGSPWSRSDLLATFALRGCATASATRFDHTLTVGFGAAPDASAIRLWLFDSGPNRPQIKYEPVAAEAVSDYERLSACLQPCGAELAYVHVPLPEYADSTIVAGTCALWPARLRAGMVPRPWCWLPRLAACLGHDRAVGCSKINSGLLAALARTRNVRALSCGHNHFNDYVGVHSGVYLCFGRISGLSPPTTWEHDGGALPFAPGGRVMSVQASVTHHAASTQRGRAARTERARGEARVETWVQTPGGVEDRIVLPENADEVLAATGAGAKKARAAIAALAIAAAVAAWGLGNSK